MDKQKRKGYNFNKGYHQKRPRQFTLEAGMTGFLCTCNFREKECVRDAYKILEEFSNELYGVDKSSKDVKSDVEKKDKIEGESDGIDEKKGDIDEEDISEALNKEIAELKAEAKKPAYAKRFQNADAGVKNVIFINTTLPDPLELALSIIKKLDETKEQKTRFLLRLVPIQVVCKANMPEIKSKADELFEKYFAQEPKTFSIVFNRHSNNKVQRNEIIEELAELISKKNPGNKADLKNPEIAVVVEVIRSFCLLSIAPEYFKYKKYNLLELCNVKEPEKPPKDADGSPESDGGEDKSDGKKADPDKPEVETGEAPKETADPDKPEVETGEAPKETADPDKPEVETDEAPKEMTDPDKPKVEIDEASKEMTDPTAPKLETAQPAEVDEA